MTIPAPVFDMMAALKRALQVRRGSRKRPARRRVPRKPIEFSRMVKRIADQQGVQAATAWTRAVLKHQGQINMAALRSAIASKNAANIEAVVAASKLQQTAGRALRQPLTAAAQAAGTQGAAILKSNGIAASFNAVHPNVVNFARTQSSQLVVAVPQEVKQVIAEVIAQGAQYGLDVAQQARAIREVVGLPPDWAAAPGNLAQEIRSGQTAAATGRRLSASDKQRIRSAIENNTVTDAFVAEMKKNYAASLVNRRALNIARTETLRASHHGLTESWKQAQEQGVLPKTARRFWIVTPDDRLSPQHARIPGMNPNGRGMDEPFHTTEGLHMFPPSRPNCRCSVGLLPNVSEGFDVTAGAEEEVRAVAEPELSPILSPEEQASAIDRLGGLTSSLEGGEKVVSTLDVGFAGRIDFLGGNFSKARRLSVPMTVNPRTIYSTQDNVVIKGVQRYARKPPAELPLVAKLEDGRMMVLEGHTRLSAQMLAGRTEVPVRVVGLDRGKYVRLPVAARRSALPEILEPAPGRAPVRPPLGEPAPVAVGDLPDPRIMEGTSRARVDVVHRDVVETLRGLDVDPGVVQYDAKLGTRSGRSERVLGGKKWTTVGEYRNGQIILDPRVRVEQLRKHVTHEAMHLKFDVAMRTDPKILKYVEENFRGLWTDDGVTEYSRSHWQQFMVKRPLRGTLPTRLMTLPVEETLAEIQAGGEAVVGSARYKKLMQMVDDAYQKAKARGLALPSRRGAGLRSAVPAPDVPKPPLRDLAAKETPRGAYREGLTNHLDTVFEDNFRAQADELAAVENYMGFHYGPINNSLRSGNVEQYLKKAYSTTSYRDAAEQAELIRERLADIKGMDKLMTRMPELGDNATVWRSVNDHEWITKQAGIKNVWDDAAKLVGTEFVDSGYVSTTTLSNAARGWSKISTDGGTLVEIRLPPNTRGAWMKKVAREQQESAIVKREYLLPRGARFKVVEARVEGTKRGHPILHLIVEYIP